MTVVQRQPWTNSSQDPVLKKVAHKRSGGVAQVTESPTSKCEALNSSCNTTKK
jgi:hypothetical protein